MGNKTLLITLILGFGLGILISSLDSKMKAPSPIARQSPSTTSEPTEVAKSAPPPRLLSPTHPEAPPLDWARAFPNAEALWSKDHSYAGGGIRREQLIRTPRFKFPLVRIENDVAPNGQTQTRAAYIGDHLLVRLHRGLKEEDLQRFLDENALRIRRRLVGDRLVTVSFESAEEPERFAEVQKLLESRQDLFESVNRDEIAFRDEPGANAAQ